MSKLFKVNVKSKEQWRTGFKSAPVYYVAANSKDMVQNIMNVKEPWEISRVTCLGNCITMGNVIWSNKKL